VLIAVSIRSLGSGQSFGGRRALFVGIAPNPLHLGFCCRQQPQSALNSKILCRRFALVRDLFVFDNLPLIQAAEAGFLDRRNVDENIFSATTPAAE